MRVIWARPALNDLEEVHRYIPRDNPDAADRLVGRIVNAAAPLEDLPRMGRIGRRQGTRELVVTGTRHIVMYEIGQDRIEVLRVMHGARRWPTA